MNEIVIYKSSGKTEIEVKFEDETVWLSLNQISELFNRDKSVISRHLKKIFETKELNRKAVVAKNATTASDGKKYEVEYFNLDAILSVGYRVNSKQGTLFRQWSTERLKEYLVKGYSANQNRLEQLQQTLRLITQTEIAESLDLGEAKGLLQIISSYSQSFLLLNKFDNNNLPEDQLEPDITYEIKYREAVKAISILKTKLIKDKQANELFGNAKDDSFKGTLQNIVQTFDGKYLYPTIEEQAANLLYLIIKNHPFTDGNKRIGSFLFIWFLEKNQHRFKRSGEVKINDNGLTALALLIAQSNPKDKDLMIKLIINLINNR
ncbi:MAG: RhuM family protein [Ginsengibacter sp.]